MSFIFEHSLTSSVEQTTAELEQDIQRFTKACKSAWPRPVDYTNLIDAQFALRALQDCQE